MRCEVPVPRVHAFLHWKKAVLTQTLQPLRENRKMSRQYRPPEFGGSPLLQEGGAGLQSGGKAIHFERTGFSPGFLRSAGWMSPLQRSAQDDGLWEILTKVESATAASSKVRRPQIKVLI